jgi:hypothetical protein
VAPHANGWWALRITDEDLASFPERNVEIREAEASPGVFARLMLPIPN